MMTPANPMHRVEVDYDSHEPSRHEMAYNGVAHTGRIGPYLIAPIAVLALRLPIAVFGTQERVEAGIARARKLILLENERLKDVGGC